LLVLIVAPSYPAGDWQRFRGPNGSGVAEGGSLPPQIAADKNVVWKTLIPAGKSSPVLTADRIYLTGHKNDNLLTFALERKSGKPVWRAERPDMVHSFSTPIVHRTGPGRSEIIVPGSYQMTSYDVSTGELVWQVHGLTYQVKSVPVLANDTVYFNGWAPGGEP